jgi:hypothetical protein
MYISEVVEVVARAWMVCWKLLFSFVVSWIKQQASVEAQPALWQIKSANKGLVGFYDKPSGGSERTWFASCASVAVV